MCDSLHPCVLADLVFRSLRSPCPKFAALPTAVDWMPSPAALAVSPARICIVSRWARSAFGVRSVAAIFSVMAARTGNPLIWGFLRVPHGHQGCGFQVVRSVSDSLFAHCFLSLDMSVEHFVYWGIFIYCLLVFWCRYDGFFLSMLATSVYPFFLKIV